MAYHEGRLADGEKNGQGNEAERLHRYPDRCGKVAPDDLVQDRQYQEEQAPSQGQRPPTRFVHGDRIAQHMVQ